MEQVYLWFLYFLAYSIVGWACETVYCSIGKRRFVKRGFLYGPYCPIYGFGALIVLLITSPFAKYPPLVFLCGVVLTSALEYFTSWLMEKLFHAKWWDYSNKRFNIHGRVCLLNSTLFGIMALALTYLIHPWMQTIFESIPKETLQTIAFFAGILFAGDFAYTLHNMQAFRKELAALGAAGQKLRQSLDQRTKEAREAATVQLQASYDQLSAAFAKSHKRWLQAFSNVSSKGFAEEIERIRGEIARMREERKAGKQKKK